MNITIEQHPIHSSQQEGEKNTQREEKKEEIKRKKKRDSEGEDDEEEESGPKEIHFFQPFRVLERLVLFLLPFLCVFLSFPLLLFLLVALAPLLFV